MEVDFDSQIRGQVVEGQACNEQAAGSLSVFLTPAPVCRRCYFLSRLAACLPAGGSCHD